MHKESCTFTHFVKHPPGKVLQYQLGSAGIARNRVLLENCAIITLHRQILTLMACRMEKLSGKRIGIDNSVVNWMAGQGLAPSIQRDREKRRDYQAIEQLFDLQERGQIVLVAVDQLDRESKKTSRTERRNKLIEIVKLCKEKYYLTRFEALSKSRRASKSMQESGINLEDGVRWVTESDMRKIREYVAFGVTPEEKVDLEVLATAAIAGVHVFVTVDCGLLRNDRIKRFAKQKDDIGIYRPSQIVEQLHLD